MSISIVLIPASQLGIRAYVYEYLGLDGHGLDHAYIVHFDEWCAF